MFRKSIRRFVFLQLLLSSFAYAQDLASILTDFYDPAKPVIILPPPLVVRPHNSHFLVTPDVQKIMRQINSSIVSQLSTFPVTSSAGSFTFVFDAATGAFNRSAESFGSIYGERANSNGKGKFSAGFAIQTVNFDGLDGYSLDKGGISIYLLHDPQQPPGNIFFKQDMIKTTIFLDLNVKFSSIFANYGISDKFDVGIAVPYIFIDMKTRIHAQIDKLASGPAPVHRFITDGISRSTNDYLLYDGSKNGVGDIVIRSKYRLSESIKDHNAFAAALEVRLPTGDEKNLFGTGALLVTPQLIASGPLGKVAYHVNIGPKFALFDSKDNPISNEISYIAGFDAPFSAKVTFAADLIGRYIFNTTKLEDASFAQPYWNLFDVPGCFSGNEPPCEERAPDELIQYANREQTVPVKSSSNPMLATFGLKFNPVGHIVITGNAFVPITNTGLHNDIGFTLAGDYSF